MSTGKTKLKIEVPTSWDDVTIKDFINLRPILASDDIQGYKKIINIIAVLTDKKIEEIGELSIPQYHDLKKKLQFLNTEIDTYVVRDTITVNNKKYAFCLDPKGLMFGEYISVMELLEKSAGNEDILVNNLHQMLTIVCRPIKRRFLGITRLEKVDGEMIRKVAQDFYNHMPISIAYPMVVFFWRKSEVLTKVMRTSLMSAQLQKLKKELKSA